jgi:uncharacterized protein
MKPPTLDDSSLPTSDSGRVVVLDILRGFALFGILLINITAFASSGGPPGLAFAGPLLDRLLLAAVILLVESKFFCLFSFLFGVGFALQLQRAERRGDRFGARFGRRLLALAAFGAAHIALLWEGDILLVYALVGLLLLPFRSVSDRGLLRWAVALLGVPLILYTAGFLTTIVGRFTPVLNAPLQKGDAQLTALVARSPEAVESGATYWQTIPERLRGYAGTSVLLLTRIPTVLALFLLGLGAGRRGVFARPQDHLALLRGVRRWGFGLGVVLSGLVTAVYFTAPPVTALAGLFFNQALAGPLLGLGYAAALSLIVFRSGPGWFRPMAAVGRMALTNYLLQSAICAVLFWPRGLGLAGVLRPVAQLGIATVIYLGEVLLSAVWLQFFHFGPLEWLWRAFTYLRWPRLLKGRGRTATGPCLELVD